MAARHTLGLHSRRAAEESERDRSVELNNETRGRREPQLNQHQLGFQETARERESCWPSLSILIQANTLGLLVIMIIINETLQRIAYTWRSCWPPPPPLFVPPLGRLFIIDDRGRCRPLGDVLEDEASEKDDNDDDDDWDWDKRLVGEEVRSQPGGGGGEFLSTQWLDFVCARSLLLLLSLCNSAESWPDDN